MKANAKLADHVCLIDMEKSYDIKNMKFMFKFASNWNILL
jgi:hypothetical protein